MREAQPKDLTTRIELAVEEARKALDDQLTDYPSARFRGVRARIVPSVYSSDEGQSDKVPWTHRGGPILVLCGQINAKNRMGGYTGWSDFAFRPSQVDVVTLYNFEKPRMPYETNIAEKPRLTVATDRHDAERVELLCGPDGEDASQLDLANRLAFEA
ncbi:hypothetical protein [Qipengyuania seohaensis]|uniref:hypothetical protein n=1 Tax=Qipengyuania seohaensis TaxID=266951 RepID=UPI000C228F4E|nr:hypothetical protein [Qipengyuania seohaensis]